MNEIDQRNKSELLFRCSCSSQHFVSFAYWDWDDTLEFSVNVIDTPDNLWLRINKAFRYIFMGGRLYWHDVNLTREDLGKVGELVEEYSDALDVLESRKRTANGNVVSEKELKESLKE